MTTLIYAGIGARATPGPVLTNMKTMAGWLARTGWHLATGGAGGADTAFAGGTPAGRRTLYLPWAGYNGHGGPDCRVLTPAELSACMDIAGRLHPAWNRCSPAVRKLHARNAAVLLSANLDRPVDAVIAWTPDGAVTGGTGMALRMAAEHHIPVMNLAAMTPRAACERLLGTPRSALRVCAYGVPYRALAAPPSASFLLDRAVAPRYTPIITVTRRLGRPCRSPLHGRLPTTSPGSYGHSASLHVDPP